MDKGEELEGKFEDNLANSARFDNFFTGEALKTIMACSRIGREAIIKETLSFDDHSFPKELNDLIDKYIAESHEPASAIWFIAAVLIYNVTKMQTIMKEAGDNYGLKGDIDSLMKDVDKMIKSVQNPKMQEKFKREFLKRAKEAKSEQKGKELPANDNISVDELLNKLQIEIGKGKDEKGTK